MNLKPISFKPTPELIEAIEAEMTRLDRSRSYVCKNGLLAYFGLPPVKDIPRGRKRAYKSNMEDCGASVLTIPEGK